MWYLRRLELLRVDALRGNAAVPAARAARAAHAARAGVGLGIFLSVEGGELSFDPLDRS